MYKKRQSRFADYILEENQNAWQDTIPGKGFCRFKLNDCVAKENFTPSPNTWWLAKRMPGFRSRRNCFGGVGKARRTLR
ncbi:MAG: hypothetical protein ABI763_14540, partial [Bacteroidota bacterium]